MLKYKPSLSPSDYFHYLVDTFHSIKKTSRETREFFFQLGPFKIKFLFTNPDLVPLVTSALEHLQIEPHEKPNLTINFWDSVSSGVFPNAPDWTEKHGGQVFFNDKNFFHKYDFISEILNSLDFERNLGIYWVRDFQKIPYFEVGSPLLSIFHWYLKSTTYQLIHGAAVGKKDGGVLLVGKGGSGKSSAAAATLSSDLYFAGDDYCLIDPDSSPRVFSIYSSAKIRPDMLDKFPSLKPALFNADRLPEEKPLFLLNKLFKEKIVKGFPLKGILIPRVTHKHNSQITRATPISGLKALAPSTIFQLSTLKDKIFEKTATLVKKIPCYHLEVGTDLNQIPRVIESIL